MKFIKKLLGLYISPEKWHELKSAGLEKVLGPEHNIVMHAIIPWEVGGSLDLYYFPQSKGFAIATKELIDENGVGPRNDTFRAYEICMFSPITFNLELVKDDSTEIAISHDRIRRILNAMARYAGQAKLNINETMEFPDGFGGGLDGQCLILDQYNPNGKSLKIGTGEYGLMCAITITKDEMFFSRKNGGRKLLDLLVKAGEYPYCSLNRKPVV